jgi:hypothetical protein
MPQIAKGLLGDMAAGRKVTSCLSWASLAALVSPTLADPASREIERRVEAGERVTVNEIRRAFA